MVPIQEFGNLELRLWDMAPLDLDQWIVGSIELQYSKIHEWIPN